MARKILRLYRPHRAQAAIHASKARFKVAAWGRQSGKSTACINEQIQKAWNHPNTSYWYVAPTYKLARIIYRRMKRMLRSVIKAKYAKKNDSELMITFSNGSFIQCQSGKEYDNLRGESLHGAVIDEVRDQSPHLWPRVIRPMLGTTKGWCIFVSTPQGEDAFFDLAEKAQIDEDWAYFTAPSTCNPLFTKEEFAAAKKDMSEAEFGQEILAEFRDLMRGSAYKGFSKENIRDTSPFLSRDEIFTPNLPIIIGLDFNVNPMCWAIGQHRNGVFYYFDEIYMDNTHTQETSLELVTRLKAMELRGMPNVVIVGDSTGKARKTSASGESDYSILIGLLKANQITFENKTPESNPLVKDRVNIQNTLFKSADGSRRLFVHSKCKHLIQDWKRVKWKEGSHGTLDPNTGSTTEHSLTHISDAAGYPTCVLAKLWKPAAGGIGVIPR